MNGNERMTPNANVPFAVEVFNAVRNYNAFVEEIMAGAYTSASALANGAGGAADGSKEREADHLARTEDIEDGRVSRCW